MENLKKYERKFEIKEAKELSNLIVDYKDRWANVMPIIDDINNPQERMIAILELAYAIDTSLPNKIEPILVKYYNKMFKYTTDF